MTTKQSEYEQLFYNDGYQLGLQAAQNGYQEKDVFMAIKQMYEGIDQLIDSLQLMAQKQNSPIHCKRGCSFCCHQAVFANSYELHYLGNFIKKQFTAEQQKVVLEKAKKKNQTTTTLDQQTLLNYKAPCPLLKNGSCSAYEARPMACRIYLSTQVSTCIDFFKNPANEDSFPALLEFPLMAGRMMNEGFMTAIREKGIEVAEFRMEEGLLHLMTSQVD